MKARRCSLPRDTDKITRRSEMKKIDVSSVGNVGKNPVSSVVRYIDSRVRRGDMKEEAAKDFVGGVMKVSDTLFPDCDLSIGMFK